MNLVGYQKGMGRYVDPNLNGWGLAFGPDGPFCVADTSTGVATFYGRTGRPLPMLVSIPAAPSQSGVTGLPAGVVYNPTSEFVISKNGKSARLASSSPRWMAPSAAGTPKLTRTTR
jgi:hypothetical protein